MSHGYGWFEGAVDKNLLEKFFAINIETGEKEIMNPFIGPPDLSRPSYLIGFYSTQNSGGYGPPGFYMFANNRQQYYSYDEAVAAAGRLAASEGMGDKQVFIYQLYAKVELEPVKPPVRVTILPYGCSGL